MNLRLFLDLITGVVANQKEALRKILGILLHALKLVRNVLLINAILLISHYPGNHSLSHFAVELFKRSVVLSGNLLNVLNVIVILFIAESEVYQRFLLLVASDQIKHIHMNSSIIINRLLFALNAAIFRFLYRDFAHVILVVDTLILALQVEQRLENGVEGSGWLSILRR